MESVLLKRWLAKQSCLDIIDEASISLVRDKVRSVGKKVGLEKIAVEEMAVVASELATNVLRHAARGQMSVEGCSRAQSKGLEILCVDRGLGIQNLHDAISGTSQSPARSLKAGLSGSRRLSDEVDVDTRSGEGTCIRARKFVDLPKFSFEIAISGRPCPGEVVSGDDAMVQSVEDKLLFAMVDAYGHGPEAHAAALESMVSIQELMPDHGPPEIVQQAELRRQSERGFMLSVSKLDLKSGELLISGVGDVSGALYSRNDVRLFLNGTGRHQSRPRRHSHISEETVLLRTGDVLVIHTDGLKSTANLDGQPELLRRPAASIAGYLLENFSRDYDDALVLVLRVLAQTN